MNRRYFVGAGLLAIAGAGTFATETGRNLYWAAVTEDTTAETMSPPEVHAAVKRGDVLLIDIRRPDEWEATGSGEGAHRLDMRINDFVTALGRLADGRKDAPIALICARGVRSARLSNRLKEAGFTRIIDVPEGMFGSSAGPGWLVRELPVVNSG